MWQGEKKVLPYFPGTFCICICISIIFNLLSTSAEAAAVCLFLSDPFSFLLSPFPYFFYYYHFLDWSSFSCGRRTRLAAITKFMKSIEVNNIPEPAYLLDQ